MQTVHHTTDTVTLSIQIFVLKHKRIFVPSVEVTGRFIDPPYCLGGNSTQIISVATDFCPERANGGWDQDRWYQLKTRDTHQSEIIGGWRCLGDITHDSTNNYWTLRVVDSWPQRSRLVKQTYQPPSRSERCDSCFVLATMDHRRNSLP
ncbi:hypothetical protein TNCV_2793381 [Trichonephila clavipes]|nr:hypothetical protein TNCV_2793381 [Trichonephila clavipes]